MKRVIRSSVVESGKLLDLLNSLLKSVDKHLAQTESKLDVDTEVVDDGKDDGSPVVRVSFPKNAKVQNYIDVSIVPEEDNPEPNRVSLYYKTSDGQTQSDHHTDVNFASATEFDECIAEAVRAFFDFDLTAENSEATSLAGK